MLSSRQHTNILLELDEEEDDKSRIASIDHAHHFLNFSRKITEASSMRKPVDIQLGISCGKDLLFGSPSRMLRRPQPKKMNRPSISPVTEKDIKDTMSLPTTKAHDVTTETNHHQSPHNSMKPTTNIHSSTLLDRLVADVLCHIESCPEQSAYSDDLDRLKPKLQAYTITRPHTLKIVN